MTSRHQGLLSMALGFAIWIAAFSVLYGVQATGCEFGLQQFRLGPLSLLHAVLFLLFAMHMGALLWLLARCRRTVANVTGSLDAFLWGASSYLTSAAIAAMLWIGLALPLPSVCG